MVSNSLGDAGDGGGMDLSSGLGRSHGEGNVETLLNAKVNVRTYYLEDNKKGKYGEGYSTLLGTVLNQTASPQFTPFPESQVVILFRK